MNLHQAGSVAGCPVELWSSVVAQQILNRVQGPAQAACPSSGQAPGVYVLKLFAYWAKSLFL